jgi:hypothetical protein
MVKHIHATVDDDVYERVKYVKDAQDLTWAEFLVQCADSFENGPVSEEEEEDFDGFGVSIPEHLERVQMALEEASEDGE